MQNVLNLAVNTATKTTRANTNAQTQATAVEPDTQEFKLPAYLAIADAKRQHNEYSGNYTATEHANAEAFYKTVSEVFTRSRVYLTCRGKYITVKVDKPLSADKVSVRAVRLQQLCETHGITAKHTVYGNTVYELTRKALATM